MFLSFGGEDTHNNFTDHLYNMLVAYGIRDEELQKGEEMTSNRVSQHTTRKVTYRDIILVGAKKICN